MDLVQDPYIVIYVRPPAMNPVALTEWTYSRVTGRGARFEETAGARPDRAVFG